MAAYPGWKGSYPFSQSPDINAEIDGWFSVSGDLDDFIFYEQDDKPQSER